MVKLDNVTKSFNEVVAVDNINLDLKKGEIFSLLGPSGCGKTTTLRIIGGFENPDTGEIYIDDQLVTNVPPYKRDCSTVFQNLALFPHMTVAENLSFGLEMRKVGSNEIKEKISEILNLVRLEGMQDRLPEQLSGGQMQRVALARSLVLEPKVLLLDEPLAALDRKLRKEMQAELKQIHENVGLTFLYVTHDQKVALGISDRIGIMRNGKLDQIGPPSVLYQRPATIFVADFMGGTNILKVKGSNREFDNQLYFETHSGLKINTDLQNDHRTDVAAVSIRPEKIKLYPKEKKVKEDNTFRGTILAVVYQGDFTEVDIILDQEKEKMVVHFFYTKGVSATEKWLSIGQQVVLGWDSRDTIPLSP